MLTDLLKDLDAAIERGWANAAHLAELRDKLAAIIESTETTND